MSNFKLILRLLIISVILNIALVSSMAIVHALNGNEKVTKLNLKEKIKNMIKDNSQIKDITGKYVQEEGDDMGMKGLGMYFIILGIVTLIFAISATVYKFLKTPVTLAWACISLLAVWILSLGLGWLAMVLCDDATSVTTLVVTYLTATLLLILGVWLLGDSEGGSEEVGSTNNREDIVQQLYGDNYTSPYNITEDDLIDEQLLMQQKGSTTPS